MMQRIEELPEKCNSDETIMDVLDRMGYVY